MKYVVCRTTHNNTQFVAGFAYDWDESSLDDSYSNPICLVDWHNHPSQAVFLDDKDRVKITEYLIDLSNDDGTKYTTLDQTEFEMISIMVS
jgi:hypothetical protein